MRKKLNDIRIRRSDKAGESSVSILLHPEEKNENILEIQELNQDDLKDLISSNRRNFLKILVASGGVLLAGSFLNKINKFKDMSLVNQGASTNLGIVPINSNLMEDQDRDSDYKSFFENFRIIKNSKEYILYNKYGDNILTIDRDS